MSQDTAGRFMQVANNLSIEFRSVRNLAPTALYALAAPSTPEPVREDLLRNLPPLTQLTPKKWRHMRERPVTLEKSREMLLYAAKLVDRRGEKARPFLQYAEELYAEMKANQATPASEEERIKEFLADPNPTVH